MAQPTSLIVCPTSHMDWDWNNSFEEYYKTFDFGKVWEGPVQQILDAAFSLLLGNGSFDFSMAEVGWLQRYILDQGGTLPSAPKFCLMGGAITSPDNIVCDGEVFVRAYLVGRQWAQSVGLGGAIANVSWLPDDFGHDPELPVILSAMGLSAVGVARVPGAFPNFNSPLNGQTSMACSLMAQGVALNWQAGDGSAVFMHFMPNTYGVPFWSQSVQGNVSAWIGLVQSAYLTSYPCSSSVVVWPGNVAFAPAGGDFSVPNSYWADGVTSFNQQQNVTAATFGTFPDYVSAVLQSGAGLATDQLDPSNFWTGFFGSRPALKIRQARASRNLVAAEAVSSLLRLGSKTSSAALDALDSAIGQVWGILAPSSHHDFVTGTSPDSVYKKEQFPMVSLAASLAEQVYQQAIQVIADSIVPSGTGTVVAVHNAVGVQRGGVFELARATRVSFEGSGWAMTQEIVNGKLLVQAPEVESLGYISGLVRFDGGGLPQRAVVVNDQVTINNGALAVTLSRSQLWAITSIVPSGGANVLPSGAAANLLEVYHDNGNLYQYGNEPMSYGGFSPWTGALTAGTALQTEFGPLRWRVEANVTGPSGIQYRLVYTLIAGESLVRMSVTGSAPTKTTVVTTFPAVATDGVTEGTHLIYGTAHHYHEDTAPAYWTGPTFKATHNFLMPAADSTGALFPLAAIYHGGMPAWACYQGTLLGSLFRNTPGTQRGASGTDFDTHTQEYALRISRTALDPAQGTPLVEALLFTNPLRAALASVADQPENPVTLPSSASLASAPSPALVRVVRPMGEVKSAAGSRPMAQVALRIYRPDADGTQTPVQVDMPVLTSSSSASAALVTALEQPIANAPAVTVNGTTLTVPASFAVTTVAVKAVRPSS